MKCKSHPNCRTKNTWNGVYDFVDCPWCGYRVSVSNPYNWCANCYVLFEITKGVAHFNKDVRPNLGQAMAIALAKSGGAKIGNDNGRNQE